ncbi:hypothetical protein BKA65DRAFT_70757 [Rhexocercosporidium sp. MPI-PUGE-AT-0058]|nr:hypothetical protein BKA65DRAFT_70757 [Rhexocercosporidium sp. MPI-PUGE-AT-0058]
MKIQFTTAEDAFCGKLKTREGHEEHISRPHVSLTALPNPAEPLEMSQLPLAGNGGSSSDKAKLIANLWLQLLVIQVQNANFWNMNDVEKLQGAQRPRPLTGGPVPGRPMLIQDDNTVKPGSEETLSQSIARNELPEVANLGLSPAVCITRLTPAECSKIERLAQLKDPRLEQAVVELICLLPYLAGPRHRETYQIAAFGNILDPFRELECEPNQSRKLNGWGPNIPSHVLQLTAWDGNYGRALFVDTKTWEGVILEDYQLRDPDERDPKWEYLVGDRKPIGDVLQQWIKNFMDGKWMPSGGDMVHEDGPRRVVNILMDNLKHKSLLQEFGWPSSFPLPAPDYQDFLVRKHELYKQTFHNNSRHFQSLSYKWLEISHKTPSSDIALPKASEKEQSELLPSLNTQIRQCLDFHERRIEDREYAIAADVPM